MKSRMGVISSQIFLLTIERFSLFHRILQELQYIDKISCNTHQENMSVTCISPSTLLLYNKTGVDRGIPIFLIFAPNIDCGYSLEAPHHPYITWAFFLMFNIMRFLWLRA